MRKRVMFTFYAVLLFSFDIPKAEMQKPNITDEPSSPLHILEGDSVTLKWTYSLGGLHLITTFATDDGTVIVQRIISDAATISAPYRIDDRVTANVTDTFALITYHKVKIADSNTYDFNIRNTNSGGLSSSTLQIIVLEMQKPNITSAPPSLVTVVEGKSVNLEWTFNSGRSTFRHAKFGTQGVPFIVEKFLTDDIAFGPAYVGRITANITETNASIKFIKVDGDDSRTYDFIVSNQDLSSDSKAVEIKVQIPPRFNSFSPDQVVEEGAGDITLTCDVAGEPSPNIIWTKVFPNGSDSDVLFTGQPYLFSNNRNNAGTYRCEADNGIGSAINQTIHVTTNFKPENVHFTVKDSNVCRGDVININCSVDGSPAVHIYQLFENDTLVSNSSTPIAWSKPASTGGVFVFRCEVINLVGTSNSTTTLTVKVYAPSSIESIPGKNITEGYKLTLTCQASGTPPPTVSWIKVSSGQRTNGNVLDFIHINRSQAGEYKCEASNVCGNASEAATIDVQYPPVITDISGSQALNVGATVTLICTADGNPAASITWTKDGNVVTMPLIITGIQDEGAYRCTADNDVGSPVTSDVSIIVHFPASIVHLEKTIIVTKGGSTTLFCNVSGRPTPSVTWTHIDSGKRVINKTWVIDNIGERDLGEYRCDASNMYRNASNITGILFKGGRCETLCTNGQRCRKIGKFYSCLCNQGKKGQNCQKTETLKKVIPARFTFKKVYRSKYDDLENQEAQTFVNDVEGACSQEYKSQGYGFQRARVSKLSQGSVIADVELTFQEPVSESEIRELTRKVTEDGKLGQLEIIEISVGEPGPDFSTAVPSVPANVNKDVIYGPVIGVLALILISVTFYVIIKTQRRQRVDRQHENPDKLKGTHFDTGIEDERNIEKLGPSHWI